MTEIALLATAVAANPARFVRGVPPTLPTAAWIYQPSTQKFARKFHRPTVSLALTGSGLRRLGQVAGKSVTFSPAVF
jgi:hypothetical protein